MDKSKKFPVYQFSIKFKHKNKLKEAIYVENLYPEEFTEEEAKDEMASLMYSFEDKYPRISKNFTQMEFKAIRWEEWHSEYSFHFTFQLFEDEQSAFDSFRAYLKEKVEECMKSGIPIDDLEEAKNEALWIICPCDGCKSEGKTTLLHSSLYFDDIVAYQASKAGENE